jgi:hypothetical protein
MAKKEKITFSARKDPLLRHRPTPAGQRDRHAPEPSHRPAPNDSTTSISRPPSRKRTPAADRPTRPSLAAVEEPVGVIAVPTLSSSPGTRMSADQDSSHATELPTASQRSERSRQGVRRAQTSMSLAPSSWDSLDELGHAAGASAGELLVAILTAAIPDTPAAALEAIEELLVSNAPDEGMHEERNYRLPLDLRTQLDALTKALGPSVQRSLLIRALLAAHTPDNADNARQLIIARRIAALRASAAS